MICIILTYKVPWESEGEGSKLSKLERMYQEGEAKQEKKRAQNSTS